MVVTYLITDGWTRGEYLKSVERVGVVQVPMEGLKWEFSPG